MSKEIDRYFDLAAGQCILRIEDDNKAISVHTINMLEPDGREADVQGHITRLLCEASARADKLKAIAVRNGYKQ